MMRNKLFFIAITALLSAVGCTDSDITGQRETAIGQTITLTASMPTGRPETRLALTETDEGNISVKWKEGDKISLCFVSGETVRTLNDITVTNIREEGKKADFDFSLPEGIHYPFNLYGIYGATLATDSKTVTFPAAPAGSGLPDTEPVCVMRFAVENLMPCVPVSVSLTHLGSLLSIQLTNSSDADYMLTNFSLAGDEGYAWLYNATGQATYDIASGTFIDPKAGATLNFPLPPDGLSIAPGTTAKVYDWIVPTATPDASKTITATLNETAMPQALPAKAFTAGNYYRLKLVWDGTEWKRFLLPPASDLMAYWPMDGNADDVSGNEHHGTIFGGVTPTEDHKGRANSACLFNGTDGYINLGSWENGGAMTFAFWARWDAFNYWSRIIELSKGGGFDNGIVIANRQNSSNFSFHMLKSTIYELRVNNLIPQPPVWVFYSATVDNIGIMKVYKNGILQGTYNGIVPALVLRSKQYIGRSTFSSDKYFQGAIDDLRIYNRALSAEEVLGLYYSTK